MISTVMKYDESKMSSILGRCSRGSKKILPVGKNNICTKSTMSFTKKMWKQNLYAFILKKLKYKIHYFNFNTKETQTILE